MYWTFIFLYVLDIYIFLLLPLYLACFQTSIKPWKLPSIYLTEPPLPPHSKLCEAIYS